MAIVMFEGRAFQLQPNIAARQGQATEIFEDPITRQKSEGVAIIREIDEDRTTDEMIEARVEFVNEPGQFYDRRIWRRPTGV